jgi:hypothetical protein
MSVKRFDFAVTTNAAGGGTVISTWPITGTVLEVRMPLGGTALTAAGGTADFTITRTGAGGVGGDGGTVLALTNVNAPWQYQPRNPLHSNAGGTTAYTLGTGPVYDTEGIPVDSYLTFVAAQCQPSVAGTVHVFVDCD